MIRLATSDDAAAIAAIYDPVVTQTAISFEEDPPGPAGMRQRIEQGAAFSHWLVDDEGGSVRGYAYASKHRDRAAYRWSVDSAIYVHPHHRGRGVGRALYTALFARLRQRGFCAVHAGITLPNEASVALHEALGFRRIGVYPAVGYKLGAWHDVGWWQLELRERTREPGPLAPG